MNILHCEATYIREDEPIFFKKAFELAGFNKEEAVENVIDNKEVKYILGDKVVRFVKFDSTNAFSSFYFQYHVLEVTEEDKVVPKKIFSSKKKVNEDKISDTKKENLTEPEPKKEIVENEPINFGIESKKTVTDESITPEKAKSESFEFFTEEDLTGDALKEHLEANGQISLF